MKTKFTELFQVKYPIVQGAMAWVSDAPLAAAVSNAGGLGTIATSGRDAKWVKEEVQKIRTLTDKPFSVNVVLQEETRDEIIDTLCELSVPCVSLGAGNPVPYFEKLKSAGVKSLPVVPNLKLAKRVQDQGADALVIEGMEAGGHIGTLTTMALMTQVIRGIDIPVIAAGGFADGRGVAAALIMGASAVQMGTRFYASTECTAHIDAKNLIVQAGDTDTDITGYMTRNMVRGIRNEMTQKYLELEAAHAPREELTKLVKGSSRRAPHEGDVTWGLVQAGQSLSVIQSIDSCQDIIERIIREAKEAYRKAGTLFE